MTDSSALRARHLGFSLASLGAPAVGAFLSLPTLLERLSPEAFGLLTMYWVIIGYASLVELGMGKAVAKRLAELDETSAITSRSVIGTAIWSATVIGIVTALLCIPLLRIVFGTWIEIPQQLHALNRDSIVWISATVPILVLASVLSGVLEARRDFGWLALIRVPTGLALFVIPAMLAHQGFALPQLVAGIMVVRLLLLLLLAARAEHVLPRAVFRPKYDRAQLKSLLSFGGWLTISAIIGPLLVYLDRFILASTHGLATSALYSTAFEAVIRFLVIASAVVAVMFPRFSNLKAGDKTSAQRLYLEGNLYVLGAIVPVALVFILGGHFLFSNWLGRADLDSRSLVTITQAAAILSLGLVLNACAHIPQAFIQARGYPHWTAGLHVMELGAFLLYAPPIVKHYGVEGAACTWLIRSSISAILLYMMAARIRRDQNFS